MAKYLMVLVMIMQISSTAVGQSLSDVQARCAQKTRVYNRDGVQVGEKIDAYCAGFLEGAFGLMKRMKRICSDGRIDGGFLLSVVNNYVSDQRLKTSEDAADTIEAAYQRAFPCHK
jgi:hypothetical protein